MVDPSLLRLGPFCGCINQKVFVRSKDPCKNPCNAQNSGGAKMKKHEYAKYFPD